MVILIALAVLGAYYPVTRLLRAQHDRAPRIDAPPEAPVEPIGVTGIAGYDGPTWSALDDRQLTRLLTNAAPRSTTE